MRFHALVTDYDGTIARDGVVDPATIAALEAVRASGRRVVLVTGRELDDLRRVFDRFDLFDRVVAENGGLLARPASREEQPLTEAPDARLVAYLRERQVEPLSVGRSIIATWEPNDAVVLEGIRELGLELQITFNKGAVMVLPAGVNKASGLMAALRELGLSPHNAVGVGDAENDHAFLSLCELSAAVANALPTLKDRCDLVLEQPRGEGVAELVEMLLEDRLAEVERSMSRLLIPLGEADGVPLGPASHRARMLLAGASGGGKSTLVTAFVEGLTERGYQVCLVDPEGDYEHLGNLVILGTADRAPALQEVETVLTDPVASLAVNLLGVPIDDRPRFFDGLLARLLELRARTGRPHWLVVDEAHHLLPAEWRPEDASGPVDLSGTLLVTVHPDRLPATVLERLDTIVAIGDDASATIAAAAPATDGTAPTDVPTPGPDEAVLWQRDDRSAPPRVTVFTRARPREASLRHRRKYAAGELGEDRSFWFRGPEDRLSLRAQNLQLFVQIGEGVDDETWLHHLHRGDYSSWVRESIKDEGLANAIAEVEHRPDVDAAASRRLIREAIEATYTAPA